MFRKSLPDFKRQNVEIGRPEPIPERPTAAPAMTPLEPSRSPGFLLWHATLRWQRAVAASLAPLNLTHVQFVLLASTWWLNGRGQSPNQIALAAHAGTDVKMTSQVLRSLERKGLVKREVDPADARARAEHIARVFLLEPEKVEKRSVQKGTSKRRSSPTFAEFEQIAEQQGVGDLYRPLLSGLRGPLRRTQVFTSRFTFGGWLAFSAVHLSRCRLTFRTARSRGSTCPPRIKTAPGTPAFFVLQRKSRISCRLCEKTSNPER